MASILRRRSDREMKTVDDYARIRYAFHTEHKKIREIARELHCGRRTVRQAVEAAQPPGYRLSGARPAPVLSVLPQTDPA